MAQQTTADERTEEMTTADDLTDLAEGDTLTVEYTSVQGGEQEITGTVETVRWTLHPDEDDYACGEALLDTDEGRRKVAFDATPDGSPSVTVKTERRAHDTRTKQGDLTSRTSTWAKMGRRGSLLQHVEAEQPTVMCDGGQKMDYERVAELIEDGVNTNQGITEALDSSVGHVGRVLKRWANEGRLEREKDGHAYVYSVPDEGEDEQEAQEQGQAVQVQQQPGQQATGQQGGDSLRAPVDRDYDWASRVPGADQTPEYISHNGEKQEIELEIAAIQQWMNQVKAHLREELGEDPTPEQITDECRRREQAEDEYAPRLPRYMVDGPTGCGKTTLATDVAARPPEAVKEAAEREGIPVVEVQFTYDMSPAELLGSPQLVAGNTVWEDGGLTQALLASREGPVVVVLDEVPRARPEVHSTLMDALDHRARVKLTGRGHEEIQGVPHNLITVATANLGDEYQHFEMDPAHKRRLGDRHSVDYLGVNYPHREADLVSDRSGCPDRLADLLVEVANAVRERADDTTSDVRFGVPTAALIDWAQKARSLAAYDLEGVEGVEDPVVQAAMGTVVRRWYDGNQAEADTVRQVVKDELTGCPYDPDDLAAWAGEQEYVVCAAECGYSAPISEAEDAGVLDFMECPSCDSHVDRKTSQEMQDEGRL